MSLESMLAGLDDRERGGQTVDEAASTWRLAGVTEPGEVELWLAVGVFDGYRASLLKAAGVDPIKLAVMPDARKAGFAFAMGQMTVAQICNLIVMYETHA